MRRNLLEKYLLKKVSVFNLLFVIIEFFLKTKRYAKRSKGASLKFFSISHTNGYSEPNQKSKIEHFGNIVAVTAFSH